MIKTQSLVTVSSIFLSCFVSLTGSFSHSAFADAPTSDYVTTVLRRCSVIPSNGSVGTGDIRYQVDLLKLTEDPSQDGSQVNSFIAVVYNAGNIRKNTFGIYPLLQQRPNGAGIQRYVGPGFEFQINSQIRLDNGGKSGHLIATSNLGSGSIDLASDSSSGQGNAALISCN